MNKNMQEYLKLTKDFAINQLIDRWVFEIQVNQKLFSITPSLDELISDSHSIIILSKNEYKKIYEKVLDRLK